MLSLSQHSSTAKLHAPYCCLSPHNAATLRCVFHISSNACLRGYLVVHQVRVGPGETLFNVGDSSAAGIFIVVEGKLGVFLEDGLQRLQTNTLHAGETVGDLDVLDGAALPLLVTARASASAVCAG